MRQKFLAFFPVELLSQMVSIKETNESEVAWSLDVLEKVIYFLMENKIAIRGGRMFQKSNEDFYFTGLEWDIERNGGDWDTFVQRSVAKALSFLKKHRLRNSECVCLLDFVEEEEMIIQNRLPKNFPKRLVNFAYLLDSIGSAEIAWEYEASIHAINFYAENGYVILGGDVYETRNEYIRPTLDNWYYNSKNPYSLENIPLSRDKAIFYIKNYYHKNGDRYIYTLVVRPLKQ